jgi:hypothetical protein
MRRQSGFNLQREPNIWGSRWLPALVVPAEVQPVSVRQAHGPNSQVVVVDHLDIREPACRASDTPRSHCGPGGTANQTPRGYKPSRLTNCTNQLAGAVVESPRMKTVGA